MCIDFNVFGEYSFCGEDKTKCANTQKLSVKNISLPFFYTTYVVLTIIFSADSTSRSPCGGSGIAATASTEVENRIGGAADIRRQIGSVQNMQVRR